MLARLIILHTAVTPARNTLITLNARLPLDARLRLDARFTLMAQ